MKNKVLYDWLTFTTKIHDVDVVIDLLGLSDVSFLKLSSDKADGKP